MSQGIYNPVFQRQEARSLIDLVLDMSRADETEVTLGGGRICTTCFANNHITQNTEEEWSQLSVMTAFYRRGEWCVTRGVSLDLSPDAIRELLSNLKKSAKTAQAEPNYVEVVHPEEYPTYPEVKTSPFDTRTYSCGPVFRASQIVKAVLPARKIGLQAAGFLRVTAGAFDDDGQPGIVAFGNSKGVFHYHLATRATMSMSVTAYGGSNGWAEHSDKSILALDPLHLSDVVREKARMWESPLQLTPGRFTVLLEPAAVADLLHLIANGFSARSYEDGNSPFSGRLNGQVFAPQLQVRDDVRHPLHLARPFDDEGVPTQRVDLIVDGRFVGLVFDRHMAKVYKRQPTGHGYGLPDMLGYPVPRHLVMEAGSRKSLDDLIAETDQAILITRLFDNHLIGSSTVRAEGMTRDGLFWIERGRIVTGLKNMRYNVNLFDIFKSVDLVSKPAYANGLVVPAVRAHDFELVDCI